MTATTSDPALIQAIGEAMALYVRDKLVPLRTELESNRTALAEMRGEIKTLLTIIAARESGRARNDN